MDDVGRDNEHISNQALSKKKRKNAHSKRLYLGLLIVVVMVLLVVIAAGLATAFARVSGDCAGKLGRYRHSAVSTDALTCSEIGMEMMKRPCAGVVDSAIAALICTGAVNFHSMGIGGGSFFTFYSAKEKKFYTLDSRETAPIQATENMYNDNPVNSKLGGMAIAVPGEVKGMWELHQKFGKLPWKDLFQPTIRLLRKGYPVGKPLAYALQRYKDSWVHKDPFAQQLFVKKDGTLVIEGDMIKMERLARTLEEIAELGANHFYSGQLADRIVKEIRANGGVITKEDLVRYEPKWRKPVVMNMTVKGEVLTMATLPPPSSGALVEFILKTLSGMEVKTDDFQKREVETWHRIMEVYKHAYAIRSRLGDSDFVDITDVMGNLTSESFQEQVRSSILYNTTRPDKWYGDFYNRASVTGTSHISILGSNGDAISVTSTINHYFGSKVIGNITGIVYNNEMDDFSIPGTVNYFGFPASETNFIKTGKRPMSSMSPIIVTDQNGDVRLVTGASGGSKIIASTALVMIRDLLYGENLKDATDAPRIYEQWMPNITSYEYNVNPALIEGLSALGHVFKKMDPSSLGAIVQTVERKDGFVYAYADKRKGGCVSGQ